MTIATKKKRKDIWFNKHIRKNIYGKKKNNNTRMKGIIIVIITGNKKEARIVAEFSYKKE